jgi:hypothetical protein
MTTYCTPFIIAIMHIITLLSKTRDMSSIQWPQLILFSRILLTCPQYHDIRYYFLIKDHKHVLNVMTSVTTFLSKITDMSSIPWHSLLLSYQRLLTCLQFHNFRYFFLIKDYRHVLNTITFVTSFLSKITDMSSIPWLPLLISYQRLLTCPQYHDFRCYFAIKHYIHVCNIMNFAITLF